MIRRMIRKTRIDRDTRGVTVVEFGFVAAPLALLLVGSIDLGYRVYLSAVLQGVVHQAARKSTIEGQSGTAIDSFVRSEIAELSPNGTVAITRTNYNEFTGVAQPERISQDTTPVGRCNPGDWYIDENYNGRYDRDRGRSGQGGADDIIRYDVSVSYPRMISFGTLLGTSPNITIDANTVMQNQPYAAQSHADPQELQVTAC